MDPAPFQDSNDPDLKPLPTMLIAGLQQIYTYGGNAGIPSQWQRFNAHDGHICRSDRTMLPMASVPHGSTGQDGAASAIWPPSRFATPMNCPRTLQSSEASRPDLCVFAHRGHISGIQATCNAIFTEWLPSSGYEHAGLPDMIERYDERFDPENRHGASPKSGCHRVKS